MTLKFCKRCKTLLSPHEKNGKLFLECKNCGFCSEVDIDSFISKEKIKKKKPVGKGVAEDKDIFATYHHECEKCGYNKAEIIDMGIFYSDEDNLIFLKCGKCGNVERVGDKAM